MGGFRFYCWRRRGRMEAGEVGEHVRYLVEFVGKSERGVIR